MKGTHRLSVVLTCLTLFLAALWCAGGPAPAFALASVPGAPTGVSVTPGDAQGQVSFTPPASDGGSPILYYTVTANFGGFPMASASGVSSPITVGGLFASGSYGFTVTATNTAGTGPASSPVNATVTPTFTSAGALYNVSGTIHNGTSSTTGRIYVVLMSPGNTNPNGSGTSIDPIPAGGNAPFVIHGVPQGNYQIFTFSDKNNIGSLHINDPATTGASFTVGSGDYYTDITTISPVSSPTVPSAVAQISTVTTNDGAMLMWKGPKASYGGSGPQAELADSYVIYWGAGPNPGNGSTEAGSKTVTASGGDYHVFVGGLTQNSSLYFAVKAVNSQNTAYFALASPVTIAAPTGNAVVSGRVYSPGVTKSASTPLYVFLQGQSHFYATDIASPGDLQTWSISGVQPDNYKMYVILDLNNDGFSGPAGHLTSSGMTGNGIPPIFQVATGATSATAPDVTLTAQDGVAEVRTANYSNSFFSLQFSVGGAAKRPVAAQVTSGPGLTSPMDLSLSIGSGDGAKFGSNGGGSGGLSSKPQIGDTYTCTVTYADGSVAPLTAKVTGVVESMPNLAFPAGNTTAITTTTPFAWQTPGHLPAGFFVYALILENATPPNNWIWGPGMDNGIPPNQTSVLYNYDNSANQSTLTSGSYSWSAIASDAFGNQGMGWTNFTPVAGGPTISGFTITSGTGKPGDAVTINGSGFSNVTGVSFNGTPQGTFTVVSNQITTTVPPGATVGPVTVTANGITGASSNPFPAQIVFSNSVATAAGVAIPGATVSVIASDPPNSTVTDGTGAFGLTLPSGIPYTLLIHDGVHHDSITQMMTRNNSNSPTSGSPYNLFLDGDLPFSVASKGLIVGRVKDWDSNNPVGAGIVLTAMSMLHPGTPYPVYYTNPAGGSPVTGPTTSTASDSKFFVPNADEGDFITVTGTLAGEFILPTTYLTHTGAVSTGKISATPLPVATANPASGTVSTAHAITLAVSSPIAGDSYAIWYTTDGSDPSFPGGSRTKYSTPFTLGTGNVFLRFYAINTSHGVSGNEVDNNYTVFGVPGAPTSVSATGATGQASVSFTPPTDDGGSAITSYTATSNPGNLAATGSASPLTVTGLTNGTSYTFTVTATNAAGTGPASAPSNIVTPQALLNVLISGTGTGSVNSSPVGIACTSGSSAGCTAGFNGGSVVLTPTPGAASVFAGWGGDCSGTGPCSVTMNANHTVSVTFTLSPKAKLLPAGTGFATLQSAYNAASTGNTIAAQVYTFQENLIFNNPIAVFLNGGMDSTFTNYVGRTTVRGTVDITNGTLRPKNLAIH